MAISRSPVVSQVWMDAAFICDITSTRHILYTTKANNSVQAWEKGEQNCTSQAASEEVSISVSQCQVGANYKKFSFCLIRACRLSKVSCMNAEAAQR